jgi:uridine kinase
MQSLLDGKKTLLPRYDFKLGRRSSYDAFQLNKNSVIIVEGIQAVYPEITEVFENTENLSVFISTERGVCCGESSFSATELRLIRRLVRDSRHRGATAEFTFSIWKSVTDNEAKSILPYKDKATLKIDSSMGYEPYVMRQFLIPLLQKDVSSDSPYYMWADSLVQRLIHLPSLDPTLIPIGSVYYEFIG